MRRKRHAGYKAKAQKIHAKRRCAQRYGFTLSDGIHDALVKQIHSGTATRVRKQSNRVTIFDVQHDGRTLRVVYDRNTQQIVTFLPRDKLLRLQ